MFNANILAEVLPIIRSPVVGKSSLCTGLGLVASGKLLLVIFCSSALSMVLKVLPLTKIPGGLLIIAR
ncbi:hypothetical protein KLA_15320 [Cellulophaga geojensis KL-A]|uniref:Uncharacterized protein n=1 Tax=Cellulophaga geojensis KL-A TaxID=1328323 RepID=A0ABN0RKB6_9FLAO|nr:hypothetical protein KLA_15320 [Cellulophaga geojensis KL-A]